MLERTDSLFVDYDPNRFGTYKTSGLTGDTSYGNYLDKALQGNDFSRGNTVVDHANPLGLVRYGPSSNIAGKYLSYISGGEKDLNTSPRSKYGFTDPSSFRASLPPSAGDLMRGWGMVIDTDRLL